MASNNSETVWVGCKLPSGIHLDVHEYTRKEGQVVQGARKARVTIKGSAMPRGMDLTGFKAPPMEGGYALTEVPRSHWEQWINANKDAAYIKSNAVFMQPDLKSVQAKAREYSGLKTGFEALNKEQIKKLGVDTLKNEDQQAA